MKLKLSIIILLAIILTCCNSENSDPFENVEFGKVSKKHFVNKMIEENIFNVYFDDKEKPKDTTSIGYVLENVSMKVNFNEELTSTKYNFGSLRKLIFTFGKDTLEYGRTRRASGSISKKDIDKIYNKYLDFYGKPDSLVQVNEYKSFDDFFEAFDAVKNGYKEKDIDKNYIPGKKAMWKTKYFILRFEIPAIKKNKEQKLFYQTEKDNSFIKITYEMINYDNEFQKIQDSIASNLKPSDLVLISTGVCEWSKISNNFNDTRLEIKINKISRLDRDEPKRIKGVRFDLIIEDSFKEELFKSENLTVELPTNSYLESRPEKGAVGQLMKVHLNRTFWREFNSRESSKLVKLKKYSENNKINIICKIKSVIFEDDTVLK